MKIVLEVADYKVEDMKPLVDLALKANAGLLIRDAFFRWLGTHGVGDIRHNEDLKATTLRAARQYETDRDTGYERDAESLELGVTYTQQRIALALVLNAVIDDGITVVQDVTASEEYLIGRGVNAHRVVHFADHVDVYDPAGWPAGSMRGNRMMQDVFITGFKVALGIV